MTERSSRLEVRNPLLALSAARELRNLPPEAKAALRALLRDLKAQCREKEAEAYRKRKGPMVAYWMACGTYCKHTMQAVSQPADAPLVLRRVA